MDTDLARQAAEILYQHRQAGTVLDTLPAAIRPESRAQGYHFQARLEEDRADKRVGWKIAATSQAPYLTGPIAGRMMVLGPEPLLSITICALQRQNLCFVLAAISACAPSPIARMR